VSRPNKGKKSVTFFEPILGARQHAVIFHYQFSVSSTDSHRVRNRQKSPVDIIPRSDPALGRLSTPLTLGFHLGDFTKTARTGFAASRITQSRCDSYYESYLYFNQTFHPPKQCESYMQSPCLVSHCLLTGPISLQILVLCLDVANTRSNTCRCPASNAPQPARSMRWAGCVQYLFGFVSILPL